MELKLNDPRGAARTAICNSVDKDTWKKNRDFVKKVTSYIEGHRILKHPIVEMMNKATFDANAIKAFHLEFGYAFAQVFTDAVLRAMSTCAQLERRLGPKGKMASRFLLQINMLDELGFAPNAPGHDGWAGHPDNSHYVKFHETLEQLGVPHKELLAYKPSPFAIACRQTFESTYDDHVALTCMLACAESVFDVFAGPWARNTGSKTNVKVEGGYHSIHVLDNEGHGIDDDHSEDMWTVACQAITPDRYDEMFVNAQIWVETWCSFADALAAPRK